MLDYSSMTYLFFPSSEHFYTLKVAGIGKSGLRYKNQSDCTIRYGALLVNNIEFKQTTTTKQTKQKVKLAKQ